MPNSFINLLFFFIFEIFSIFLLINKKAEKVIYNKKFCNDIFYSVTYFKNYSTLKNDYEKILEENSSLKELIKNNELIRDEVEKNFEIINATVINSFTSLNKNYFTIDKGALCGIKEGMSVCTDDGFVGVIASVGKFYSTVIPLLHDKFFVSAQLNNSKATGTIKWEGDNLKQIILFYIPKYIDIQIGEEIFTSGFNSSVCPNLLIGTVDHLKNTDDSSFHTIVVNLKNDFNTLHNVFVMSNELLKKKIELEKKTIEQYG